MPSNKKEYQKNYESEKVDTISFKTKKGARLKLKSAAAANNKSLNGFIRDSLNAAVLSAIGEPMEKREVSDDA